MGWVRNNQTGQVQWIPDAPAQPSIPANPVQNASTQANTVRTGVQTRGDMIDNQTKAATQPYSIAKAKADAQEAQQRAAGITPEYQQANIQRVKNMAALNDIINSLQSQYEQNFKGAGGTAGRGHMMEYMPARMFGRTLNEPNDLFNSTAMRAGPFIKSLLFPGAKDTDAAAEYQQKIMPFIPSAGDGDAVIESKIGQLRDLYMKQMGMKMDNAARRAAPKQPQVVDYNKWGK